VEQEQRADLEAILRLLERCLVGEASATDEAALAQWIAARPERQGLVDALRAQWGAVPATHDVEAAWARMAQHIRRAPSDSETDAQRLPRRAAPRFASRLGAPRRSPLQIAVAACAAAIIGVVAFRAVRSPHALPEPVYTTAARQRADIHLSDGTRILLAPESRLRLAADFGKERRDVYVAGEAYLEVVHDSTRPFTVFAANASVRDIGTAFTVRSYSEDRAVRVAVRRGAVALSGAGPLAAGDVGYLTADGKASVRHHANIAALLGWVEGRLVFEDAPLRQVLEDLRRWYGVDAGVADSLLAGLPFTGSLHDVSPPDAIAIVAATLGLRVRHVNTHVVLERQ